jgi:hypothetical protein
VTESGDASAQWRLRLLDLFFPIRRRSFDNVSRVGCCAGPRCSIRPLTFPDKSSLAAANFFGFSGIVPIYACSEAC